MLLKLKQQQIIAPKKFERFFCNMPGYEKNVKWAKAMQKLTKKAVYFLNGNDYQKQKYAKSLVQKRTKFIFDQDQFVRNNFIGDEFKKININRITAHDLCDFIISIGYFKFSAKNRKVIYTITFPGGNKYEYVPIGIPRRACVNYYKISSFSLPYNAHPKLKPYIIRAFNSKLTQRNINHENINRINSLSKTHNLSLIKTCEDKWKYIDPALTQEVWKIIDNLFISLLEYKSKTKNQANLHTIIHKVAEIHWFFAQAKLYRRGNASIADVLTKVLFDYLEVNTSRWRAKGSIRKDCKNKQLEIFIFKNGVAPDLEAFVTPLPDYINNYEFFYESKLNWNK